MGKALTLEAAKDDPVLESLVSHVRNEEVRKKFLAINPAQYSEER